MGVWRLVETQAGPTSQPSLWIFTARHFSRMHVNGPQARQLLKDPQKPSPAEVQQAYDSFTANTGTYTIAGDSIVFDVTLAKNPNLRGVNANAKATFKVEGNTLTVTNPATKAFQKLTRVE